MVRIGSIDSVLDLTPAAPGSSTKSRTDEKRAAKTDSVALSADAQQVSAAVRNAESATGSEVRQKVVDEARQRIEEGTYRLQSVVQLVAARITHYL